MRKTVSFSLDTSHVDYLRAISATYEISASEALRRVLSAAAKKNLIKIHETLQEGVAHVIPKIAKGPLHILKHLREASDWVSEKQLFLRANVNRATAHDVFNELARYGLAEVRKSPSGEGREWRLPRNEAAARAASDILLMA
jgi:hypothetical protein